VSWLNELEQIVEEMQSPLAAINSSSRLWLTSMPSVAFPVPILQNGIKITNEPPRGLRANLTRTFEDMSEDEFETSSNPTIFKKLLFATAFFNGLIIERRNFGAVGWNIPYDWMNSDLKAAMMQLRMYAEDRGGVPWETLNVVVADIIYGGRVTDVWDKRTISSLLRKLFTPALLGDGFSLSDGEDAYRMPTDIDLQTQIDFVRGLPINDAPELFGLRTYPFLPLAF
jgi:dynein heavy chain